MNANCPQLSLRTNPTFPAPFQFPPVHAHTGTQSEGCICIHIRAQVAVRCHQHQEMLRAATASTHVIELEGIESLESHRGHEVRLRHNASQFRGRVTVWGGVGKKSVDEGGCCWQ
jgi:hypothetical protein